MNFESLNFFDKISLGITGTVNNLLVHPNIVFLMFSILLVVYIFKIYKNILYRAVAFIPLIMQLIFSIFKNTICTLFPYFGNFYEYIMLEQPMVTMQNYESVINFLPLILSLIVLGSIFLSILLIFKNLKNNVAILIYISGIASRIMLGFSPTIFSSTDRTFLYFEFSLIIIGILIWKKYMNETDKVHLKVQDRMNFVFGTVAVMQYVHTFIYTIFSQM